MTTSTTSAVRKTVTVAAPLAIAFEVFTAQIETWWPMASHHIGDADCQAVVIEPRVGGRWYEVGDDGTVCEWGKVLEWEPPRRFVLAWQLNHEWQYDPDFVTELEVRFVAEGDATRVDLEHRNLERYGERVAEVRRSLDAPGGWTGALEAFAAAVAAQS